MDVLWLEEDSKIRNFHEFKALVSAAVLCAFVQLHLGMNDCGLGGVKGRSARRPGSILSDLPRANSKCLSRELAVALVAARRAIYCSCLGKDVHGLRGLLGVQRVDLAGLVRRRSDFVELELSKSVRRRGPR